METTIGAKESHESRLQMTVGYNSGNGLAGAARQIEEVFLRYRGAAAFTGPSLNRGVLR